MREPAVHPHELDQSELIAALLENLRAELRSAATYRYFAECERDRHRKSILGRLADAEDRHAERWRARLAELGVDPEPEPVKVPRIVRMRAKTDLYAAMREAESIEDEHLQHYQRDADRFLDPESSRIMREIAQDEARHAQTLHGLTSVQPADTAPRSRLDALLKSERHVSSGTWIADAIYGANDGLGAVFGIVAGVAGGNASAHFILLAGIAGAVASAVSMGSGAYLAAKSEREVHEAELSRERREIRENPDEEREELALFYQLKGLTEDEATVLADRISRDEEQFLKVLASEELGLSEERLPSPTISAFSASVSTGIGAIVPVIPFFFVSGATAIIAAAIVSLIGHFVVGALKSLVTIRSWWSSGLEMTLIGVLVGAVTYAVGYLVGVG
jgi:VIT1/CCC1 family predicted Fe2+/Mn2+ transporter/rubrerythrin